MIQPVRNKKQHFKMDTLNTVLNVVKPKHWAISIDLTDAYLHVPIFLKHWKILIKFFFLVQNQCYQCRILAVLWSNFCTKGVHQNGTSNSCLSENTPYSSSSIFKRLVGSKPMQRKFDSRSREMLESGFVIYVDLWVTQDNTCN